MTEKAKRNLKPAIVLGVICLVVALLIGMLNLITAPKIEAAKKEAISKSLRVVMPNGLFSDSLPLDGMPDTVTGVYEDENGGGHVVTLSTTKGYTGKPILVTVGVDLNGKITGAVITSTQETKDTDKVAAFTETFKDKDASGIEEAELVSGATYSSSAVKDAIWDAMVALGYSEQKEETPSPEDSGGVPTLNEDAAYNRALGLIDGATSLTKVTVDGMPANTKAIYRDAASGSYVLYVATRTQWVATESEGMVVVKSGTIQTVDMITWTVGHDVDYTTEYLESFLGKDKTNLDGVELVTGATGTSQNFANAVKEAMEKLPSENGGIPTLTEDEAYDRALALVTGATALTKQTGSNLPATVKAIYLDEASGTYVLYLATRTQWVATETEGMVAVKNGTVVAVDMITWTVGHDVDYTTEYLESFLDKNKTGLGQVELVTGATGTSQNFVNALKEALVYTLGGVPTLSEQEAYDRALGLIEGATTLEQPIIIGLPDTTKAVYFDATSGTYVLYVATRTQWVATESEGMIVVKDGTIQTVDMITWTVGHGVDYTTEYLESFLGKDKTNLDGVELVTGATGTSQNFLDAVQGAMDAVVSETDAPFFPAAPAPIYRYIGIGIAAIAVLLTAVSLILRKRRGF